MRVAKSEVPAASLPKAVDKNSFFGFLLGVGKGGLAYLIRAHFNVLSTLPRIQSVTLLLAAPLTQKMGPDNQPARAVVTGYTSFQVVLFEQIRSWD